MDIREGDSVLFDSFAGLVPATVVKIDRHVGAFGEAVIRITATRRPYKKGEDEVVGLNHLVRPEEVRRKKYGTSIVERPRRRVVVRRSAPRSRTFMVEVDGVLVFSGPAEEAISKAHHEASLLKLGVNGIELPKDYRAALLTADRPRDFRRR